MRIHFFISLLAIPVLVLGEDSPKRSSDSEKIDSILIMQKQVVRTIKNDPLADKNFGVEVNLVRMLYLENGMSFSAGFSLFNLDRNAEIAFPFLYSRSESDLEGNYEGSADLDFMEITQDAHYRYFLGNTQNGFYLSAFARFAFMEGVLGESIFDGWIGEGESGNRRSSEGKLGGGVGMGYRKFSYKGLFWGCSLNFGRYFIGDHDRFRGGFFNMDADEESILDVEILKFGWAF